MRGLNHVVFSFLWMGIAISAPGQTRPETSLSKVGELIVSTSFNEPTPKTRKKAIHGWQAAIGEWWIEDEALHGDELPEDNHHSSCTYKIEATDLIISAKFRLGTASQLAIGCRDSVAPHHHLARTYVTKDAIWVTRMSGISKTTKSEKLAELKIPLDPEAWHTLTIEILGDHFQARVNGQLIQARHERFQDAKGIVALISKGQGAQFKDVSIWKAM